MKQQQLTINTLRVLSVEAVSAANSGHPGICLGAAPIAYSLWANNMRHNPKNPKWQNRDRFVLSAGHGSALLYSLLYVFGYGLSKEDLQKFRQMDSLTPGHPEYMHTVGVETSTGPLGQGIANAVGMAQAETILAKKFNKPNLKVIDHYTYCLCGDGDMMEGIESESASLAGTWKLGKLIVLYDSNNITIDGTIDIAFTEDVARRHEAQGWQVLRVSDGTDIAAITAAIDYAKTEKDRPTLVIVSTVIGYGSTKAGSHDSHGSPLNDEEIKSLKGYLGWDSEPFEYPSEVAEHINALQIKYSEYESDWQKTLTRYKKEYPQEYTEYIQWHNGLTIASSQNTKGKKNEDKIEVDFSTGFYDTITKPDATRNTSGNILNQLAKLIPNLVSGSADLFPSNKTFLKDMGSFGAKNKLGRNIHYGIREHAMAGIANGMSLHGGLVNIVSTFFVFSDYLKPSMRMSAIMRLPVLYVLTHDSIGVGEDGPTHQPIEHLTALRAVPNLKVFRPADHNETVSAYESWLSCIGPVAIVLSRQNLVQLPNSGRNGLKGGYIVSKQKGDAPQLILIATGSEVGLAINAQEELLKQGIDASVVSMPSVEVFENQTDAYKQSVLSSSISKRVAIEAGSTMGWYKFVGLDGAVVGIDSFGKSGKPEHLFDVFGINLSTVVEASVKVFNKK